jgi:transposase
MSTTSSCPNCERLEAKLATSERCISRLEAENADLRAKLDKATREGKRQAAPFSRNKPKDKTKKPGRKKGQGYGKKAHRAAPEPAQIDETHEAKLPGTCPHCGGDCITHTETQQQYQVELPARPIHRQFNVHIGQCQGCFKRVQGRHELQTSDALGAAKSQIGPNAQAFAVWLNKDIGVSHGKVAKILGHALGIVLRPSAVTHIIKRAAKRAKPAYDAILAQIADGNVAHMDETGWRVAARLRWLWAAVDPEQKLTAYLIGGRDGATAAQVLPTDYCGVLVHDGWIIYGRYEDAVHQTCLYHLLVRARHLAETLPGRARALPRKIIAALKHLFVLRDRRDDGEHAYTERGWSSAVGQAIRRVSTALDYHGANEQNRKLVRHMEKHFDELFTFLFMPGVAGENSEAERAMRPAVVNRKVWGGNRTPDGAQAQQILMSVIRTATQQGRDALAYLAHTLRARPGHAPLPFVPGFSSA